MTRERAGIGNSSLAKMPRERGKLTARWNLPSRRKATMQSVALSSDAISAAKCHRRSNANWSRAFESLPASLADLSMIQQRDLCSTWRRWMIQLQRGLAAYRAANAIGRIKLVTTGMVHKVVDAQTLARYVPSLTWDVRNAKGHYPGTWRDSPSIRPASRRVFETMIYRSSLSPERHPSGRNREIEGKREIYGVRNSRRVRSRAKQASHIWSLVSWS